MTKKILQAISKETIYSHDTIKDSYDRTKSFDKTILLSRLGCAFNIQPSRLLELADMYK